MKTIFSTELAARFGKSQKTLASDMVRRPESLPRWFKLPGSKKPIWLEETVDQFLLEQAEAAGAAPTKQPTRRK